VLLPSRLTICVQEALLWPVPARRAHRGESLCVSWRPWSLRKASPALQSCNNLLPLAKSRAASHSEPPNFAFDLPVLAELHGAAPGIEPGASRARGENHDSRPRIQVPVDTHKLTLRAAGPKFRHRCFGCCFYADIQL